MSNSFNIEDEVEPLEFDFVRYAGPDAKGTIPEPSTATIMAFQKSLQMRVAKSRAEANEDGGKTDDSKATLAELEAAVEKSYADAQGADVNMVADIAAVCGNFPSAEMIAKLPFRGQRIFIGWIIGKLLNPEAERPASS